jgi:hypothetical protein
MADVIYRSGTHVGAPFCRRIWNSSSSAVSATSSQNRLTAGRPVRDRFDRSYASYSSGVRTHQAPVRRRSSGVVNR